MGVTRRQFLVAIGAGAAAAGGVVGTRVPAGRRVLHDVGLLVDDDLPVPSASVTVEDGALASGRRYRIARTGFAGSGASPAAADAAAAAGGVPVVFCLHGRARDHRFAFDSIGVHKFAAAAGLDLVVASLDGGPSGYWHKRASGDDPLSELVDALVPLVDKRSGGGPRSVMGWSMGGYGALLAGERHPDVFPTVAAASPAVWRRAGDAAGGAFDGPADFAAHDVLAGLGRLPRRVRVDCGSDDPFEGVSRELLRRVPGAQGGIRAGFHDDRFWRRLVPEQLAFITAS